MAYSDREKETALILLAHYENDYERTSEETGIAVRTLSRWVSARKAHKKQADDTIEGLLEELIYKVLRNFPDAVNAKDAGVVLGILIDKWLLLRGQPTERVATILEGFTNLEQDEKDAVIREAQEIIRGARSGDIIPSG